MRRRPIKILLALFLGLCFVEGGLWVAHWMFGAEGRGGGAGSEVLCIGDSHTFGWNVDAPAAWPARLEGLAGVRVTNRAAPGKNTQTLLEELDEYLALDEPQLVLIQAGLNNPWSRPHQTSKASPLAWSRTAKLLRILVGRFDDEEAPRRQDLGATPEGERPTEEGFVEVEGEDGFTEVRVLTREGDYESFTVGGGTISFEELDLAYSWIQRDLTELCERVTAAGATPVLLTYAYDGGEYLPQVNFVIRETAVETGALLVDVAAIVGPRIEEFSEERLFFHDAHPRREGYSVVARVVHDGLVEAGLIAGEPVGDPFAELLAIDAPAPRLTVKGAPGVNGGIQLELAYEPGLDWSLVLSSSLRSSGGGTEDSAWLGLELPLAPGELLVASQTSEALRGSFDAGGQARLELTDELLAALGPKSEHLYATLVARTRDWAGLAVGEPVLLR